MSIEILLYAWSLVGLASFIDRVHRNESKSDGHGKFGRMFEIVGVTLFIYYVSQILGSMVAYIYPALRGWDATQAFDWFERSSFGQFILIFSIDVWTIGLLSLVLRLQKLSMRSIGLRGKPKLVDLGYVLAGFAAYFLIYAVLSSILDRFVGGFDLLQKQEIGFTGVSGMGLVAAFFSLVILPPAVEEVLTRGFLFSSLRKHLPYITSAVITSVLFGIAHLQPGLNKPLLWVAALDTFILSMVLVWIREKRGNLWACMGLHMLKNLIAFLAIFIFKIT